LFSSRRRHTRFSRDWSSDVCSSDLQGFNKRLHFLPKYIAVCFTEKGVQYAVQLAKQEQLPVAVKSGGHSFEGFSSNDGGLVINRSEERRVGKEWRLWLLRLPLMG